MLPEVDPNAWIEALPELFGEQASEPPPDDGHWNLLALRNELNLLLREDAEHGWWRLAGIGGVRGDGAAATCRSTSSTAKGGSSASSSPTD